MVNWLNYIIIYLTFVLNLIPKFNLCPGFHLIAYLHCTEPFRKNWDGSQFSFLGNNRQHLIQCAKMISSCIRKVQSVVKTHIFLGTLWDAVASAALACGLPYVHPAGRGLGQSFLLQLDTIFKHMSCNVSCRSEDNTNGFLYSWYCMHLWFFDILFYYMHACYMYEMVVHSGGLYTGYWLIAQVTPMLGYLYTLFTLWHIHLHTDIYYNNWYTD